MNDKKHEAAKKSYETSPELHVIEIPTLTEKEKVSNCQMCGTGRGMRKPSKRLQIMAHLRCRECNLNVCGAGCWQLLHGFYDLSPGKGEVLPLPPPRGKQVNMEGEEDADDEAEDDE